MKRITCLLCALVLMLFTACQGPTASGSTSAQSSTSVKHILFWDMPWGPSEYSVEAKALVNKFNSEHPTIKVQYQTIPWDGWVQSFVTAVSSNSGPDVSTGGAFLQNRMAAMNKIGNVDSIINDLKKDGKISDFVPGTIDNFVDNGKHIALPINCDLRAIYYRKDMFAAAGLQPPKTWSEFYTDAKALTKGDVYGYVTSGQDMWAHWEVLFWTMNNGGGYLDKNLNAALSSKSNIQALDFIRKLKDNKILPPGVSGYKEADASKLLYQGKAAMYMCGPSMIGEIPPEVSDKIGVLAPLTSPAGLQVNPGSTNGIMLYSACKSPDAAKTFIEWWSENSITLWSKGHMGAFPARLSLMKDSYFQTDKLRKQFVEKIIPKTVQFTFPIGKAKVEMDIFDGETVYTNVLQALYTTNKSSKTILDEANVEYQKAIDTMRSTLK